MIHGRWSLPAMIPQSSSTASYISGKGGKRPYLSYLNYLRRMSKAPGNSLFPVLIQDQRRNPTALPASVELLVDDCQISSRLMHRPGHTRGSSWVWEVRVIGSCRLCCSTSCSTSCRGVVFTRFTTYSLNSLRIRVSSYSIHRIGKPSSTDFYSSLLVYLTTHILVAFLL